MSMRRTLRRRGLQLVGPGHEPGILDSRPARALTSREAAKVLGAVLGAMSAALGAEKTKLALEKLSAAIKLTDVDDQRQAIVELEPLELPPGVVLTLSGILSALAGELSTEAATDAAVRFWIEKGCAKLQTEPGVPPWLIPDAN